MKKIEKILKKLFPNSRILRDINNGFYFIKPAFCSEEIEQIIKQSCPDVYIINTKGADGENTIFLFE